MQKPYSSIQASSLSAFVISKTHINGQKLRERQLNAKCAIAKVSFFVFFLRHDFCSNIDNSKTVQALTLILVQNGCSSQCAASQPLSIFLASFAVVYKCHSQHSVAAVRCEGRDFLMLCASAHVVPFPGQIPRSFVWERQNQVQIRPGPLMESEVWVHVHNWSEHPWYTE